MIWLKNIVELKKSIIITVHASTSDLINLSNYYYSHTETGQNSINTLFGIRLTANQLHIIGKFSSKRGLKHLTAAIHMCQITHSNTEDHANVTNYILHSNSEGQQSDTPIYCKNKKVALTNLGYLFTTKQCAYN